MLEVVVFDFDGVIINSNKLKYDAFFKIFSHDSTLKEIVAEVLNKHREASRFQIIRLILTRYYNDSGRSIEDVKKETLFLAEKYNQIVEQGAINCSEIPGARTTIEKLSKQYPLYINSTTPIEPLKRIIFSRSLNVFKEIFGGPESKIKNLSRILERENTSGSFVSVVGDGISDLKAAEEAGCHFIGIRNEFNNFNKYNIQMLDDLLELPYFIDAINNNLN